MYHLKMGSKYKKVPFNRGENLKMSHSKGIKIEKMSYKNRHIPSKRDRNVKMSHLKGVKRGQVVCSSPHF